MISSNKRFHGYASLRFVYRHGQVVRNPLFSIKYSPNKRRINYRLAIVVNKKVSKSAVVRNRIRRRLYEVVRSNQENISEPYDLVITVFSDRINDLSHTELNDLVKNQLAEARVIQQQATKD